MSYFESDANFERLLTELDGWRGTPFLKNMGQKGIGADCVRFVEAVLVNLGAIDPVKFPKAYVTRGGGRRQLDIFLEVMDSIPKMERVEPAACSLIQRGDVLLCSTGEAMHHLAIVAKVPVLWHCLRSVCEANIWDPIVVKNLHAIYRVKE